MRLAIKLPIWLYLALLVALISGCATQLTPSGNISWKQHQQQLQQLQQWHIKGKMGYHQGSEGGSAWLDWHQNQENFEVILSGPFGAGTTSINGNSRFTRLQQTDQQPIVAGSATELTRYLFGWYWPVEDLRYWVRGIPSPRAPVEKQSLDEYQLLATLEQGGWLLEFSRYGEHQQRNLPGKIRGRLLADDGDTAFTLIIKSWQLDGLEDNSTL